MRNVLLLGVFCLFNLSLNAQKYFNAVISFNDGSVETNALIKSPFEVNKKIIYKLGSEKKHHKVEPSEIKELVITNLDEVVVFHPMKYAYQTKSKLHKRKSTLLLKKLGQCKDLTMYESVYLIKYYENKKLLKFIHPLSRPQIFFKMDNEEYAKTPVPSENYGFTRRFLRAVFADYPTIMEELSPLKRPNIQYFFNRYCEIE